MSISFRNSIRWIPDEAAEPTQTVVLTGSMSGAFLDVRFEKDTRLLDWAFAGYRYSSANSNWVEFRHYLDSRTLNAEDVIDKGCCTNLPDGTSLEVGEMVNPQTGKMTSYEEVWEDAHQDETISSIFMKSTDGTKWQACVGNWQLGMGRTVDVDDNFYAWQAIKTGASTLNEAQWDVQYQVPHNRPVSLLPPIDDRRGWTEGSEILWDGDVWLVIEVGK